MRYYIHKITLCQYKKFLDLQLKTPEYIDKVRNDIRRCTTHVQ